MLQSLQAAVVYGMLCSQYSDHVSTEDAAWVVATIEVCDHHQDTGTRFTDSTDHRPEAIRDMFMDLRRRPHMLLAKRMGTDGKHEKVSPVETLQDRLRVDLCSRAAKTTQSRCYSLLL
jgi:hypothetical protein